VGLDVVCQRREFVGKETFDERLRKVHRDSVPDLFGTLGFRTRDLVKPPGSLGPASVRGVGASGT
jgi:hypothetical protein